MRSPGKGFEWDCPHCGKSRINQSGEEGGEESAIAALRAHIMASDGEGHGPRNELPADGSVNLSDHVERIGRSR